MADKVKPTDIDIENMTIPTKEQIKTIIGKIPRKYDYFWYHWLLMDFIEFIITEWEKIRNSHK